MMGSGTLFVKKLASKLAYIHTTCNLPPPPTFSCTRTVLHFPLTGTHTYTQKSWGGHPRCDLAPQSTSFGTVALRERQHLAMAGSRQLHLPLNATGHCAARANYHVPHCSVLAEVDVRTCRLLTTFTVTRCFRCIRRGYEGCVGCTVFGSIASVVLSTRVTSRLVR